jgi:hypothetical protein
MPWITQIVNVRGNMPFIFRPSSMTDWNLPPDGSPPAASKGNREAICLAWRAAEIHLREGRLISGLRLFDRILSSPLQSMLDSDLELRLRIRFSQVCIDQPSLSGIAEAQLNAAVRRIPLPLLPGDLREELT